MNEMVHAEAIIVAIAKNRSVKFTRALSAFNDILWTVMRVCGLVDKAEAKGHYVSVASQKKQLEPFEEYLDGKEEKE